MNPVKKAEWLAALRSGSFIQGTGQLCEVTHELAEDDEGEEYETDTIASAKFCCLGVLAKLSGKSFTCVDPFLPEQLTHDYEIEEALQNALAILNDGSSNDNMITERHADMTDGEWELIEFVRKRMREYISMPGSPKPPSMTFTEIADVIEKYL